MLVQKIIGEGKFISNGFRKREYSDQTALVNNKSCCSQILGPYQIKKQ